MDDNPPVSSCMAPTGLSLKYTTILLALDMQETIQSRLAASRKELLDLGLRNPLLNYKLTKGKGVHIVDEKAAAVYDILVPQQKAMTFLALREGQLFPEGEAKYQDTRLQTDEDDQK